MPLGWVPPPLPGGSPVRAQTCPGGHRDTGSTGQPARRLHTPGQRGERPRSACTPCECPHCPANRGAAVPAETLQSHRAMFACSGEPVRWVQHGPGRQLVPTLTINPERAGSHSHNKPRPSPGGPAWSPCRDFAGPRAAPWPRAPAGDACRRQQKLALPCHPALVPAAGGTRSPWTGDSRDPRKIPPWGLHPGAGAEGGFSPLLTPPTSSWASAHPGPEALRHQGAALGLARPGHVATNT